MADNGFTQKEMLQLVLDRLDDIDSKIENKIDRKEFYTVRNYYCYCYSCI